MSRIVAIFCLIVATMWIVIALAEMAGGGGLAVTVASGALAVAFGYASYRLFTKPPSAGRST